MNLRALAIIGALLVILLGVYSYISNAKSVPASPQAVSYSQLINKIDKGEIVKMTYHGEDVVATDRNKKQYKATLSTFTKSIQDKAEAKGVDIEAQSSKTPILMTVITSLLPIVLIIGIWIFFMRQMQGGGRGAMG